MSRLDIDDRVYPGNAEDSKGKDPVPCMWFARCDHPANGLRDHPTLGQVPICQRCDDRVER